MLTTQSTPKRRKASVVDMPVVTASRTLFSANILAHAASITLGAMSLGMMTTPSSSAAIQSPGFTRTPPNQLEQRMERHKKQVDGIREAEATRDGSEVNHHQSFCQICKRIFNRLTYLSTQGAAPSSEGAAQTEATETVPDAAVDQLVVREMENRFHTRPTNGQQPCNVPKTWLVNSHRSPNRHPTRCAKPVQVGG